MLEQFERILKNVGRAVQRGLKLLQRLPPLAFLLKRVEAADLLQIKKNEP